MATRKNAAPPAQETVSRPSDSPPSREPSVSDQAISLRSALRDLLGQVNNLVRAIKRQKKQEKFLRSTLASLKELQSVA